MANKTKIPIKVYMRKGDNWYLLQCNIDDINPAVSTPALERDEPDHKSLFSKIEESIIEIKKRDYDYELINEIPAIEAKKRDTNYMPLPDEIFNKIKYQYCKPDVEEQKPVNVVHNSNEVFSTIDDYLIYKSQKK
jgi:hypothetical protein